MSSNYQSSESNKCSETLPNDNQNTNYSEDLYYEFFGRKNSHKASTMFNNQNASKKHKSKKHVDDNDPEEDNRVSKKHKHKNKIDKSEEISHSEPKQSKKHKHKEKDHSEGKSGKKNKSKKSESVSEGVEKDKKKHKKHEQDKSVKKEKKHKHSDDGSKASENKSRKHHKKKSKKVSIQAGKSSSPEDIPEPRPSKKLDERAQRRKEIIESAIARGLIKAVDVDNLRGDELKNELSRQNVEREQRMSKYLQYDEVNLKDSDLEEELDEKIVALENELGLLKENIKNLIENPATKDDSMLESKTILVNKKDWLTFKSLELEHLFDATGYKYEMLEKKHKAIYEALKNIETVKTDLRKIVKYRDVLNKLQNGLIEAEGVIVEMQNMAYNLLPASVSRHCKHVEATRKRLMDMQDDLMEKKHFARKELIITKKEIIAITQAITGETEAMKLLEARRLQELQRLIDFQARENEINEIIEKCNEKLDYMNLTLEEAQEMAIASQIEVNKLKSKKPNELDLEDIKGNVKEEKINEIKQMNEMMKQQISKIELQINDLEKEIAKSEGAANQGSEINKALENLTKATNERRQLAEKLQTERVLRKTYYNQIEDMKGAIRVYCRVRPATKTEKERKDEICIEIPDIYTVIIKQDDKKVAADRSKEYLFDHVYGFKSTQKEIFKDIDSLIEIVFSGFNVCIFAYGQTGSGKTYTLIGDMDSKEQMGVVPRAFNRFYEIIESNNKTVETETNFYMIELYNDKLLDLMKSGAEYEEKLKIVKNEHGMVIVPGVTMLSAKSTGDMFKYFHVANNNRHIAATKMNSASSRSHLILTIMFTFTQISNKRRYYGKISMIDLAGSERLLKSGVTGINQTEATSINKALTALGDVISALTSMNKGFVPYRNNKLTQLMQDSLGGTAKTLLIVNLSPVKYNVSESISSLNYAARMKTIVNENLRVADEDEVAKLKEIINKLTRGEPVVIN